jgi:hypothetical protein
MTPGERRAKAEELAKLPAGIGWMEDRTLAIVSALEDAEKAGEEKQRAEVERLLQWLPSDKEDGIDPDTLVFWRALLRAAERMRGVISTDDNSSIPAIASTARAYDRAKRRILGDE